MSEPSANGEQQQRLTFTLTIKFDPKTGARGYKVDMPDGFPLELAANVCDKVHQRLIMDQLAIEAQQIALAQAKSIQVAQSMPPPHGRRMQ